MELRIVSSSSWEREIKCLGSGARFPGFKPWLCQLPAVWSGASYSASLCLNFLMWKKWSPAIVTIRWGCCERFVRQWCEVLTAQAQLVVIVSVHRFQRTQSSPVHPKYVWLKDHFGLLDVPVTLSEEVSCNQWMGRGVSFQQDSWRHGSNAQGKLGPQGWV